MKAALEYFAKHWGNEKQNRLNVGKRVRKWVRIEEKKRETNRERKGQIRKVLSSIPLLTSRACYASGKDSIKCLKSIHVFNLDSTP